MSDLTLSHLTTAKKAHRTPLKTLPLTIAIALASPLSTVHVNASALMEEIVVTAQKREENLQDVPISISAFSGDALKEMGAESISDLGRATAGVEMNNESVTQPSYSIRGIQTDDFTVGSDPAVALYVDGVYAARGAGAEIPLDDVERIEILKGPQGTLFGRNATGGAIHYITKKPSQETEGSISGSLGDYNKQKLDFTYNTPISDTVAIRVGGSMNRRDGFIENTNGPDLNDIDSKSFRASVLWIETSVIGYLASRSSDNLVTAGNQRLTMDWWTYHRGSFDLFVSQAVVAECAAGDPIAAEERLAYLEGVPVLEITEEARGLAEALLEDVPLPSKAGVDALHIAVAALGGIDYLLTWNCKHIANPSLRRMIERVLLAADVVPPVICTPQELINV